MKVLSINPFFPYPPERGMDLIYLNLLKTLSKEHEVTVVSLIRDGTEPSWKSLLETYCARVVLVPMPNRKSLMHRALYRAYFSLHSWLTGIPEPVLYNVCKPLRETLGQLTEEETFDIVEVHHTSIAGAIRHVHGQIRKVLYMYDIQSQWLERAAELHLGLKRVILMKKAARMRDYELQMARHFDVILTGQEADRAMVAMMLNGKNVEVMPNIVGTDRYLPLSSSEEEGLILFVGNLSAAQNIDAIMHFYRRIWPHIRQAVPQARLEVVGKGPPVEVLRLGRDPGIKIIGYVPDVRPYVAKAAVYIAPIRFGSGIKVKILEGLAQGKAIAATPIAVEGMGLTDGKNVLIANSDAAFAEAVIRLLCERFLRAKLGKNALQYIEENFSPRAAEDRLRHIYKLVINNQTQRSKSDKKDGA